MYEVIIEYHGDKDGSQTYKRLFASMAHAIDHFVSILYDPQHCVDDNVTLRKTP